MMKIKHLGLQDYEQVWLAMKDFTQNRNDSSEDELWLLEHPPVYTQGQAGKPEHLLNPGQIPVVQSDRGGQVTYHGPGQLVAYILMDINRRKLGIRSLVCQLEKILMKQLALYSIEAQCQAGAPGVYVGPRKIASIGLRVKNGCSYHGIALNVNMDLSPFKGINPCGFARMEMTQIAEFAPQATVDNAGKEFAHEFYAVFGD